MSLIQATIKHYLLENNIEHYTQESLTIKKSLTLQPDEVVIVFACNSANYSYQSLDEYYSDSVEINHRITVNKGFLGITGSPQLQAIKITPTAYKEPAMCYPNTTVIIN